jgi:hypothetical protein
MLTIHPELPRLLVPIALMIDDSAVENPEFYA